MAHEAHNKDEHQSYVLVVEDEDGIRRLLKEGLTAEGFDVTTTDTAEDAFRILHRQHSDVVLLDLMLPDASGIDMAMIMHERFGVEVVAMSASYTMLERARQVPCIKGTLAKPFDWNALVHSLRTPVTAIT